MNFKEIQKLIDDTDYWDSRVDSLECKYFSDEVSLKFKNADCLVVCDFKECYKVAFEHIKSYKKIAAIKNMTYTQIPYFLNEIIVEETFEQGSKFLICKMNMFPLNVEIWCKDIDVYQESFGDQGKGSSGVQYIK